MQRRKNNRILLSFFLGFLTLLLCLAPSTARAQLPYYTNFGNFTSTNWQGWSADNGIWAVGAPTAGPGAAYTGDTQCASSGLTGNYPTYDSSRLIMPALNLPSLTSGNSIVLGFWQWFQFAGGDFFGNPASYGDVEVSVWSGTSWGAWSQVSRNIGSGSSNGWSYCSVDLYAYANQKVRIAFNQHGGVNAAAGWFIDNVLVSVLPDMPFNQTVTFGNFTSTNLQGWSADNGVWQVGVPTGGPAAPYPGDSMDTQSACTGLAGGYPTYQDSRFISPPVTLPSVTTGQSLMLGFWQWFQFAGGDFFGDPGSYGFVEVAVWSDNAWGPWNQVSRNIGSGSSNGWSYSSIDLSAYANQRIRVSFHHSGGVNSAAGWFLDELTTCPLTKRSPSRTLPAQISRDGPLTMGYGRLAYQTEQMDQAGRTRETLRILKARVLSSQVDIQLIKIAALFLHRSHCRKYSRGRA